MELVAFVLLLKPPPPGLFPQLLIHVQGFVTPAARHRIANYFLLSPAKEAVPCNSDLQTLFYFQVRHTYSLVVASCRPLRSCSNQQEPCVVDALNIFPCSHLSDGHDLSGNNSFSKLSIFHLFHIFEAVNLPNSIFLV